MIREMHLFVTGKVQGVGFRAAVKKQAVLHGIQGYAKNLPDGRVEICAQGEEAQILAFLKSVETRPGHGSIAHIEKALRPVQKAYLSFEVL